MKKDVQQMLHMTKVDKEILEMLSTKIGVSQSAVIRLGIRELAQRYQAWPEPKASREKAIA